MDVSGCGAAFYTKNNCFKVQFSSASIPLAPTISSGRQSSYGNPRLPSVVEAPTVLLGRGKPETIAGYRSPAARTWVRKPFFNRVKNLKGREGWSAFLGTNHFNNLQSLIAEAILISADSESVFIFSINGRDEFSPCGRRSRAVVRVRLPPPYTNEVNYGHLSFES